MSWSRLALVRKEPTQEDFQLPTSQASEKKQDPLDIQPPSQAQLLPLGQSSREAASCDASTLVEEIQRTRMMEQGETSQISRGLSSRCWWSRNGMNPKHYCNRETEL
ncbi:hypothetical protein MRB53_021597 [Persea americana]|uniref:Uncharacterized protein n=1 Tax=Persea americana TaxID=3435 RepID=A0ACC2L4C7_PERAE|nr:hypothetical protein MRB53_021597 [Persea americana]